MYKIVDINELPYSSDLIDLLNQLEYEGWEVLGAFGHKDRMLLLHYPQIVEGKNIEEINKAKLKAVRPLDKNKEV